jgi:hypothetical protein
MASILSPKNVGKLFIGTTVSSQSINSGFVNAATVGQVIFTKANGAVLAPNEPFKVSIKRNATATGVVSTETIDPKKIDYVKLGVYAPEVAKVVTVTNAGAATPARLNVTYKVSIRKYDGIQSPENFRYVDGFYVTSAVGTAPTLGTVFIELAKYLNAELKRSGENDEIVVTTGGSGLTLIVTGQIQPAVLGKDAGDAVQFDVEVSVKDNSPASLATTGASYNDLTVATTTAAKYGNGTGKQVALAEYALKGYENADYGRAVGFPNNFNVTYLANPNGTYNTVVVGYHSTREYTNVENQFAELTIVMPFTVGSNATNDAINDVLDQLRIVAPGVSIPANLPIV